MNISSIGNINKAAEVNVQKVNKISQAQAAGRTSQADMLTISKLSSLVEAGRAQALSLPQIRANKVDMARSMILTGNMPSGTDIANALLKKANEGLV